MSNRLFNIKRAVGEWVPRAVRNRLPNVLRSQAPDARALQYAIKDRARNWTYGYIKKRIGTPSVNGAVFSLSRPNMVVKVTPFSKNSQAERNLQNRLGREGIAPRAVNYKVINVDPNIAAKIFQNRNNVNRLAIHVMEHLVRSNNNKIMNVNAYMKSRRGRINSNTYQMILNKVHAMHRLGVSHSNLHAGNIYLIISKSTGNVKNVKIIDFGRSKNLGRKFRGTAWGNYVAKGRQGQYDPSPEMRAYVGESGTPRRNNYNMLYAISPELYRTFMARYGMPRK